MDIKKLLDFNENFVKLMVKQQGGVSPQVVIGKGDKVYVFGLVLKREEIHHLLKLLTKLKPDWIVFFSENYYESLKGFERETALEKIKTHRTGDLEIRFKQGDKTVKEGIVIQVYTSEEKLSRMIDKETLKNIGDSENFDGFLTVSDVDRVFWKMSKHG